ncbi:MAG: ABC transporter ATP-binding protein/permease [Christensenellaceae bacterium]|jgi:ABC-type lipoprotein export system ATPase subunit/ABC-type antimicrobial peptide transport system permease subunit|nr:ABC transporter ATP-binding protein/permease [Christensenellaceae bacterium]
MIKLTSVTKVYKSKLDKSVIALDDVSLELPEKGLVFIVGKSGSGKSTMLNIIGGLDSTTQGAVELLGVGLLSDKTTLDAYRNTYLGFVFQEFHLIETLTVYENIALALEMKGDIPRIEDVEQVLNKVDLDGLKNRYPDELSGGQKQRVAIARALIKQPHIILADEPTGNLDSTTGEDIIALLKNLSDERLVVIVSHDEEAAALYGDRRIELKDGKIASDTLDAEKPINSADCLSDKGLNAAKLSFKSILKFVISALKYKSGKLIASVILSVLSIMMFGSAFILSKYDSEWQIVRNMEKFGVESVVILPDYIRGGENWNIRTNMYYYLLNKYPSVDNLLLYDSPIYQYANNGKFETYFDHIAQVESETDIEKKMGLKLLPASLPLDNDSIYLTDASIHLLRIVAEEVLQNDDPMSKERYYFKNGDAIVDLTSDIENTDLIGTELWAYAGYNSEDSKMARIAGVVETDYRKVLGEYDSMSDSEKEVAEYLYGYIYMLTYAKKDKIIQLTKPASYMAIEPELYDTKFFVDTTAIKSEKILEIMTVGDLLAHRLPEYGLVAPTDNEIIINVDLYNLLFDEDITLDEQEISIKQQNVGKKISLQIYDESKAAVVNLQGLIIKGVTGKLGYDRDGPLIYCSQETYDILVPLAVLPNGIMLRMNDTTMTKNLLNDLREINYFSDAPISSKFYELETGFKTFYKIFSVASGIFLLFSILLLMNFINSGVNAKKKEIGILRALGARIIDTERIFLVESAIIASIITVMSSIVLVIMTIVMNSVLGFKQEMNGTSIISMHWLTIPVIIIMSYVITALSAMLPAYRISKMKPVDAIKKVA